MNEVPANHNILASKFPVLHLKKFITCCCASLLAPYGTLTPDSIPTAAAQYCSSAAQSPHSHSHSHSHSHVQCDSQIISSIVVSDDDSATCIDAVTQGLTSRLSYSISTNELASIPLTLNGVSTAFVLPRAYEDESLAWAQGFCNHNKVQESSCAESLVQKVAEIFEIEVSPIEAPHSSNNSNNNSNSNNNDDQKAIYVHHYQDFSVESPHSSNINNNYTDYDGEMKREFEIILTGIDTHPNFKLSDHPAQSSLVICMLPSMILDDIDSFWWCPTITSMMPHAVLDMTDRSTLSSLFTQLQHGNVQFFKRSYVSRAEGKSKFLPDFAGNDNVHPLPLSILPSYILPENENTKFTERQFYLSCTVRPSSYSRAKVLHMTSKFVRSDPVRLPASRVYLGQLDDGVRTSFNHKYSKLLSLSKIIVTVNPPSWEGDHRTWEALASGALVFIDRVSTLSTPGLIDGVHCVFYDLEDEESFISKLEYFLDREDDSEQIGANGKMFVERFHKPLDRLSSIASKFSL